MKKHRFKILLILVFFVAISSFLYFDAFATLTSYESLIKGNTSSDVAKFSIKVNDLDIYTEDGAPKEVDLTQLVTNNSHIASNKVAPGAKVEIPLKIDVTDSQVAIKFDLKIVDKLVDDTKVLTLMEVDDSLPDVKLTRTAKDTYTGVINLDDLKKPVLNYKLKFEFVDIEIQLKESLLQSSTDDLFLISFNAIQYNGEEIVVYNPEDDETTDETDGG